MADRPLRNPPSDEMMDIASSAICAALFKGFGPINIRVEQRLRERGITAVVTAEAIPFGHRFEIITAEGTFDVEVTR